LIIYLNDFEPDETILGFGGMYNQREFERGFWSVGPSYTNDEWLDICNVVDQTLSRDVLKRCEQARDKMSAQLTIQKGEGLSDGKEILQHWNLSSLRGSFWKSKKK
jgi:hypothetical protein